MSKLWDTIGQLVHDMPPARALSVADGLVKLKAPDELRQINALFGPGIDASRIKAISDLWEAEPHVSAAEVSGAFRGAAHFAKGVSDTERVELVWTGPKTGVVPTRSTEQVIIEVIDSAQHEVFIVSYVFYKASGIVKALNAAVERNVSVKILVEPSKEDGGKLDVDNIRAIIGSIPGAILYLWDAESKASYAGDLAAIVHAKFAVADHEYAFVTSANLTVNAMQSNMELGVFIRGGLVPDQLHSHAEAMIYSRVLVPFEK